jgi:hypothetical protein
MQRFPATPGLHAFVGGRDKQTPGRHCAWKPSGHDHK